MAPAPLGPTHLCLVELSIVILKQVPWSTTPCWLHLMLRKDSLAHEALWFGSPMKPTKRLTTESTSWSRKQTVVEKSLKKHGVNNKFLNFPWESTPNLGQESWQSSWLAWFLSRWQTCVAFMQMVRRNLSSCFKGLHEQQALNQKHPKTSSKIANVRNAIAKLQIKKMCKYVFTDYEVIRMAWRKHISIVKVEKIWTRWRKVSLHLDIQCLECRSSMTTSMWCDDMQWPSLNCLPCAPHQAV